MQQLRCNTLHHTLHHTLQNTLQHKYKKTCNEPCLRARTPAATVQPLLPLVPVLEAVLFAHTAYLSSLAPSEEPFPLYG